MKLVKATLKITASKAGASRVIETKSYPLASFKKFISTRCRGVTAFKKEVSHLRIKSAD